MTDKVKTYSDYGIDVPAGSHGSTEIYVRCPKCDKERRKKNRKPLGVNPDKQAWYCWHCHRSGSIAKGGWQDDPGYGQGEKRSYLPPRPLKPAPVTTQEIVLSQVALSRSLTSDVLSGHGVQVVERWCHECEDWVPHVAFAYFKRGQHVHTKYRCQQKHFSTDKQTERILYLYDQVMQGDPWEPIIIAEGEFDALALRAAGFARVCSVPDGVQALTARAKSREKAKANGKSYQENPVTLPYMDDPAVAEMFMAAHSVILAVDSDSYGQELASELARRIGYPKCKRVRWPQGVNDANQVLSELGVAELRAVVEAAEPYPVEGLIVLPDIEPEMDQFWYHGLPKGYSTGWSNLDTILRVMLGQFWVLFGPTSSGKSHFANALVSNLIANQQWPVGLCSPEWQPVSMHAISLLETYIGKPFDRETYQSTAMNDADYARGKQWLDDYVTFMLPKDRTIATMINRMQLAVIRRGVKVFVIDPWFELHHEHEGDRLAYIDSALSDLGDFFMESGTLGILVVHPTKQPPPKFNKSGEKIPQQLGAYGPSQSAAFANRADVEIEIGRIADKVTRLYVQKVRSRYQGKEGHVDLMFDVQTGRYTVPVGNYLPDKQPTPLANRVKRNQPVDESLANGPEDMETLPLPGGLQL